eukprot:Opistho-2@75869
MKCTNKHHNKNACVAPSLLHKRRIFLILSAGADEGVLARQNGLDAKRRHRTQSEPERQRKHHHSACDLLFRLGHLRWPVHHCQRSKISVCGGKHDHKDHREGVVVEGSREPRILDVAEHEKGNKYSSQRDRDPQTVGAWPLEVSRRVTTQKVTDVEPEKVVDWHKEIMVEVVACFDARCNAGKEGECDKEVVTDPEGKATDPAKGIGKGKRAGDVLVDRLRGTHLKVVDDEGKTQHHGIRNDANGNDGHRHAEKGKGTRLFAFSDGNCYDAGHRHNDGTKRLSAHDSLHVLKRQSTSEAKNATLKKRGHRTRSHDTRHRNEKECVCADVFDLYEGRGQGKYGKLHEQRHKNTRRHAKEMLKSHGEKKHNDIRRLKCERKVQLEVVRKRRVVESRLVIVCRRAHVLCVDT